MDVYEAIKNRRSVRSYQSRPIPGDVLHRLQQAIRYAPSACNNQPWHFIFITDEKIRQAVAGACNDQMWMAGAPLIVAACGIPEQAYKRMGGSGNSVDVDLAIAVDHLTLAAVAEGLGTCWIGAFRENEVKSLLGIPWEVKVVALTPVGYPAEAGLIRPVDEGRRKPAKEIFSLDRYK